MTSVSHVTTMYATKRRRRNSRNVRSVCNKDSHSKSNPSKRHRERLNQELDTLAQLLPFEQSVLSKLDKLSILRLSVAYLRTKSYFQAALSSARGGCQRTLAAPSQHGLHQFSQQQQQQHFQATNSSLQYTASQAHQLEPAAELHVDGDLIVQALNGFLLILNDDGNVFYASHTVETYLGFHQTDITHRSVFELIHSEDRDELIHQMRWNSMIPGAQSAGEHNGAGEGEQASCKQASQMSLREILNSADHRHLLERNFTVRFRCLLDNTSGFLRLDIRGRVKILYGQQNQNNLANSAGANNRRQQQSQQVDYASNLASQDESPNSNSAGQRADPMLAFFCVCIPFGPPSLLEMPSKDSVFKSKHRLDLSLVSIDSRGKQLLGLTDLTSCAYKSLRNGATTPGATGDHLSAPICSPNGSALSSPPPTGAQKLGAAGTGSCVAPTSLPGQAAVPQVASTANVKLSVKQESQSAPGTKSTAWKQHSSSISAYDLVHHDDLSYMASAHQELLKTGASSLIAYRMIRHTSDGLEYQWLQTSAKLYYKNSKPDFILCTHRPLMEEEGRDLLGKRTMDFKVTYLDVGLASINDRLMACDKFSPSNTLASRSPLGARSPLVGQSVPSPGYAYSGASGPNDSASSGSSIAHSLASLSPQLGASNEAPASGTSRAGAKKRSKQQAASYDLSTGAPSFEHNSTSLYYDQQVGDEQQSLYGQQSYGDTSKLRGSDIYCDLDRASNGTELGDPVKKRQPVELCTKSGAKGAASRQASGASKKRADAGDIYAGVKRAALSQHPTSGDLASSVTAHQAHLGNIEQQQQHQHQQHQHQQQHLYSASQHHYAQHQHHQHQLETAVAAAADPNYPAIQAAAVYAASLGHQAGVGHSYGATYGGHAYASGSSMVSPSSASYQQHQQHSHSHHPHHSHSHHQHQFAAAAAVAAHHHQHSQQHQHPLDTTSHYQAHYGGFTMGPSAGSASATSAQASQAYSSQGYSSSGYSASGYPSAEHLLHHYSQSVAEDNYIYI